MCALRNSNQVATPTSFEVTGGSHHAKPCLLVTRRLLPVVANYSASRERANRWMYSAYAKIASFVSSGDGWPP